MIKYTWFLLCSIITALGGCNQHLDADLPLSQGDTITILQTALNDQNLVKDATLYLPGQSLKLIRNNVVNPNYSLTFNRQPVILINIKEAGPEVREVYPKQFIVSYPMFKAIHKDTVLLSMVVHPGNSTDLYMIGRDNNGKWQILQDEKGKL